MKALRTMAAVICMAGILALSSTASASPVSFSITGAAFTPGLGYGQDASEDGTLLDVRFDTSGFVTQNFSLSAGSLPFTFNFGTIGMFEPSKSGGISTTPNETDALGVTATFTFVSPVGTPQTLITTGTAIPGSVSDSAVDFTIDWAPIFVSFGSGGLFKIDMLDMAFDDNGQTKTQTATITLITEATGTPLPEPSTIALLGLGLLGAAFSSRKSGAGSA